MQGARRWITISICKKMTESLCSEKDNRQQPLTLVSTQWNDVWSSFLSCFLDRNMLTPVERGEMYRPMWSGDIWWSAFIHQDCYRTLINLPTGRRPWPWQKVWIKTLLLLLSPRWWVGGGCNWALETTDTRSCRHTFPLILPQCFGQDKKQNGWLYYQWNKWLKRLHMGSDKRQYKWVTK